MRSFPPIASVALGLVFMLSACGASLPKRFVVEQDLGDQVFRRYQQVLDVEFPVEGNAAEGHTATYIRRTDDQDVRFTTAFVTVYAKPAGLAAEIKARIGTLSTYDVKVRELAGEYVWWLDGGEDRWAVWVSGRYVVKLGAPPGKKKIPEDVLEAYLDLYPSDLNEWGRAREGTRSAGAARTGAENEDADDNAPAIPKHLRTDPPNDSRGQKAPPR